MEHKKHTKMKMTDSQLQEAIRKDLEDMHKDAEDGSPVDHYVYILTLIIIPLFMLVLLGGLVMLIIKHKDYLLSLI